MADTRITRSAPGSSHCVRITGGRRLKGRSPVTGTRSTAPETEPGGAAAAARGQVRRSQTAEIVCAQRAAETRRPADDRLIDDPFARLFLANGLYRLLCGTRATARLTRTGFDRLY